MDEFRIIFTRTSSKSCFQKKLCHANIRLRHLTLSISHSIRLCACFHTVWSFRFSSGSGSVCTRRISIVRGTKVVIHNNRNPARACPYTSTWKSETPKYMLVGNAYVDGRKQLCRFQYNAGKKDMKISSCRWWCFPTRQPQISYALLYLSATSVIRCQFGMKYANHVKLSQIVDIRTTRCTNYF